MNTKSPGLPSGLVEDLTRPEAYPDDPSAATGVDTLQTHISHLYLTAARVVKLRKAVDLSFLDFASRTKRTADCHREVALNLRLAPDVYLGVAPVLEEDGHFVVRDRFEAEPKGEPSQPQAERVVVMRRLEDGGDTLSLLENGKLRGEHLDATAKTLSDFHERVSLGTPAPWDSEPWYQHCLSPVRATFGSLIQTGVDGLPQDAIEAQWADTKRRFEELRGCMEERRVKGRAVDGHGDVHLQHVWFESGVPRPVLIDCIEFDSELRRIDVASEVAFLAMDLRYRGRADLAARFLRRYAAESDDFGLFALVDAYQAYRAAVRGKVAALAAADPQIASPQRAAARTSALRHLELAAYMIRSREVGSLVLICGTVGVGKSSVAEALADRAGAVVISSDRTRKKLAGLAIDHRQNDGVDEGLYAAEQKEVVYESLLERAAPVLASGRVAILDATFGRRRRRERARAWAKQQGADVLLVHVTCDEALTTERLRERSARGTDPSDAGPDFVPVSRSRFELPSEWPAADRAEVRTDQENAMDSLEALVARLLPPD